MFAALLLVSTATASADDDIFRAEDFLTWERESQEYYFRISISMAGLIARRNDKSHGDCVDNWFFKNQTSASDELLTTLKEYSDYHPDGIILAVLQKHCGTFVYSER